MRWETCLNEHIARRSQVDEGEVTRLREQSKDTLASMQRLDLDDTTSRSKALLAYDAVRELLEALSHREGYDVHNHECYKAFLQEVIGASDLARSFDDLREQRNRLEYDAETIRPELADSYVDQAQAAYEAIESLL